MLSPAALGPEEAPGHTESVQWVAIQMSGEKMYYLRTVARENKASFLLRSFKKKEKSSDKP